MEQPPLATAAPTPADQAALARQQQQEDEQILAWARPPRPPFAHDGKNTDGDGDNANADAVASTSTSTSTADADLAARYSRKLVELRALVVDAHFRGKDLAGKGEERKFESWRTGLFFFCASFSSPQPFDQLNLPSNSKNKSSLAAEIHDAAVSAGGAQFACSADPHPLRRFLAAPKLEPELEKWLDPSFKGGEKD